MSCISPPMSAGFTPMPPSGAMMIDTPDAETPIGGGGGGGGQFNSVIAAPPIEIFQLSQACKDDPFEKKINLTIGAYRDDDENPWVLPVVQQVQENVIKDTSLNKEYLPVTGLPVYCKASTELLFGGASSIVAASRTDCVEALGGTGSLRLAVEFLRKILDKKAFYLSKPSWANHNLIAKYCGFTDIRSYRYWNAAKLNLDFEGMKEDLSAAPPDSVVVLHACAHNPTGCDLTHEQWQEIAEIIRERGIFPLFDIAYQGFATGDLNNDAWAVRYFAEQNLELFVAQSYSKNFGLYNERVGACHFVCDTPEAVLCVKSQMQLLIRANWSNPPATGTRIVASVLMNSELRKQWNGHLQQMSSRIFQMRQQLYQKLKEKGTPGCWNHIIEQIGMFSFTGLSAGQCEHLRKEYHIYMLCNGRMSMCGVTTKNVDYLVAAIDDVVRNIK